MQTKAYTDERGTFNTVVPVRVEMEDEEYIVREINDPFIDSDVEKIQKA